MFRKLNSAGFWFSRSRLRRGPVFDARLKDYSGSENIKRQIEEHRQRFERTTESFSQVMADPEPRPGKRFKVDAPALNRDIKRIIKARIRPELLSPAGSDRDDLKFLEEGRSHLHDQRAAVEFEEKFAKELFMKRETARMLKKQANDPRNFLPASEGSRYSRYLQAQNQLKNRRIDSMMNYKRNNEELQLLLDSGLMDHPDNIRTLIATLAHPHPHPHPPHQIEGQQQVEGVQQMEQRIEGEAGQAEASKEKALGPHGEEEERAGLEVELRGKTVGPAALRDYAKVEEFIGKYRASSAEERARSGEDVELLLQVREYERSLFLSRYEQINFRFRGRVQFQNFREFELLSYLKHEPIEPLHLLHLFEQYRERLSKFKVPVLTPAVISRIYARTSTYRFAEDDQNNRVNLLAHPAFVALESALFRELDKISDELYCDAVWTYATNHEQEEGLLNVAMSDAVQRAIFAEMLERVGRLREADLGLLVRSLGKLSLVKSEEYRERWGEVVEVLRQRLPAMKEPYEYESVMEFVQLLPASAGSVETVASNIGFFGSYAWEDRGTVLSFARVCSMLLNSSRLIDRLDHNKVFLRLSEIIAGKADSLKALVPALTINQISSLLVVFAELNKFPNSKEIPPILVNIAKKAIVDSIHMQKHKVYQYTVPTLINALSAYDYYKNNIKTYSRYIASSDRLTPFQPKPVGRVVGLRHLLPGRTFVFNSKLFFVYHELAKFLESQHQALSLRSVAESLYGLSVVQYKNQGVYDSLAYKMLERLQKQQKQQKRQLTLKQTRQLIKIVSSYSLQRRNTNTVEEIYDKILREGKLHLRQIPISALIPFFGSYVNIFSLPTELPQPGGDSSYDHLQAKWQRNKASIYVFTALYRDLFSHFLQNLQTEQLITLYIITTHFLNNTSRILESSDPRIEGDFKEINKRLKASTMGLANKMEGLAAQSLKIDYKFAIALCLKLSKQDIKEDLIPESAFHDFEKLEKEFYDQYIEEILSHEQHVGASTTHTQAYRNMAAKLKAASPGQAVDEKAWRIEVPGRKEAYFIATYEHLMSKGNDSEVSLGLFGLWKLYAQLYRRDKWAFHLVCSMLE